MRLFVLPNSTSTGTAKTGAHMSDETAVQAEAAQEPTNAAPTGAEPGKQTEARTFTQADLDRIVTERLAKEKAKADAAVRKAQEEAEAKRLAEQGEFKALFERTQAELEQERARAKAAEIANMRQDVAARFNLTPGLAKRLQGETLEDIEADAQQLLADLPKPQAPNINASAGTGKAPALPGGMTEDTIRQQAVRLGVPYEAYKAALVNGK